MKMASKASLICFLVLFCVATCSSKRSKWVSTDPCKGVNCNGNGACVSKCNAYKCICKPGMKGKFCQKELCSPNPCKNGGKCHIGKSMPPVEICSCPKNFDGHRCERQCKKKPTLPEPLDAMFLVDGSWSVNEGHEYDAVTPFQMALRFLAKFVKQMNFGEEKTRVGFMQFSAENAMGKGYERNRTVIDPDSRITLDQSVEFGKQKIINKILSSKWYGGQTETASALEEVLAEVKEDARLEKDVMKYLFVMTDGQTMQNVVPPSKALKALGFHIFAIGIGPKIKESQLLEIANGEANHVFMINDYQHLDKSFFKKIVNRQCKLQ